MKQLLAIVLIAFMLSACTKDKGEPGNIGPTATFTCTGTAQTRTVLIKDDFFEPATLDACVGDTIKWVRSGSNPHTTTSTNVPAGAQTWNVIINSTTTSYTYVVDTTGTYDYECLYHSPGMVGKIIVH